MLFATLAVAILFSIMIFALVPRSQTSLRFVGTAVAQEAGIGAVLWWAYRRTGAPRAEVFPFRLLGQPLAGWMWLQLAGTLSLSIGLAGFVQAVWPKPERFKVIDRRILEGGGSFAVAFVLIVLVGPVLEELFFRGLVFRGFSRRYGPVKAIGWSAFLFAIAHVSPWQFAPTLVGGLMLGLWRAEVGSLWFCVVGHALNNAVPVLLHEMGRRYASEHVGKPTPGLVLLALCAIGGVLFADGLRRMVRSRVRRPTPS